MILIQQTDGKGKITGRCDTRCYNARRTRCECICGGQNHGVGLKKAADNIIPILLLKPHLHAPPRVVRLIAVHYLNKG